MKTIQLILVAILFSAPVFAADASKQNDVLANQVSVTRDALQQVLTKMKNAPIAQSGSNPDFIVKAEAFNAKVEPALAGFEKKLRESILKEAAFYVERLNSIVQSPSYSESQKRALFADQLSTARTKFKELTKQYNTAVLDLYKIDFGFEEYKMEFKSDRDDGGYRCDYDYVTMNEFDGEKSQRWFLNATLSRSALLPTAVKIWDPLQKTFAKKCSDYRFISKNELPTITEAYIRELRPILFDKIVRTNCFTSSCLALYSDHRNSFISFVAADIDQDISFSVKTPSGFYDLYNTSRSRIARSDTVELVLNRASYQGEYLKKYLEIREGDSKDLPFEISDREFQEKLKEQEQAQKFSKLKGERAKSVEELKSLLLNPPQTGLFSSYDCPRRVAEVKEDLCRTELGCLSNAEVSDFVKIINEADVDSKSRRIQCIGSR